MRYRTLRIDDGQYYPAIAVAALVMAVSIPPSLWDCFFTAATITYWRVNRRADLALDRGRAWRVPRLLDAAAMHRAAPKS